MPKKSKKIKKSKNKTKNKTKKIKNKPLKNKTEFYCGNNASHPSLLNGSKRLGTRYECLNKGIRYGLSQPIDSFYSKPYTPIDPTKKYCGLNDIPVGYDRYGNLYECFSSGIGVGKRMKAKKSIRKSRKNKRRKSR
jgi:hypothetical protein